MSSAEISYLIWAKDNEALEIILERDKVSSYLEDKYSGEQFVLRRSEGVFQSQPNIEAIFFNELEFVYTYRVTKSGKIKQVAVSSPDGMGSKGYHYE